MLTWVDWSYHYLRIWDDGNLTIDYGVIPMINYGRIWALGPDPAPLTTTTGLAEYGFPPGIRPDLVPNPYLPSSYAN